MSADPADDTPATLAALPDEVLLRLLIFLPPADILRFSVIAKRFRFVAFDNALWRHMYAATYPASFAKHAPRHAADAAWIELVKEAAEVQKRFRTGRPYTHLSLPGPRDRPLGHTGRVFGVALVNSSSADMHTLSAGDDGHLKLWNLDSSKCLASYMPSSDGAEGGLFDVKRDVIYSDRRFLTSTFSGRAQILDLYEPGTVGLETMKVAELKEMLHNGGISSAGCFGKHRGKALGAARTLTVPDLAPNREIRSYFPNQRVQRRSLDMALSEACRARVSYGTGRLGSRLRLNYGFHLLL